MWVGGKIEGSMCRRALGTSSTATHSNGEGRTPIGDCVADLVSVAHRGMAVKVASHDLNPLEFALLSKEEWTTTQLARELPANAPRVSRAVTRMVDLG